MVYITVRQSPAYHHITFDELFSQTFSEAGLVRSNESNTRTYRAASVSRTFTGTLSPRWLIGRLCEFNESTKDLRETADRHSLYRRFFIPKRSGGLRPINAPCPALMDALRRLKRIFEDDFRALYHTCAFAYVNGRSTVDAVRHQQNESRWFAKLDIHDFFGSTTPDFVMRMFSMVFPFSEIVKYPHGREALATALDLAFLDGGLPQGTPISPLITNIMMIPVDFELSRALRDLGDRRFVYTRYADDFLISSRQDFSVEKIAKLVADTLGGFSAPFRLNEKKTRYGSSAGSNWNLGVMLNKDNNITVGYRRKRTLQSMLYNYVRDRRAGVFWTLEDVQHLQGELSYCRMVEPDVIDAVVAHLNEKLGADIRAYVSADLRSARAPA